MDPHLECTLKRPEDPSGEPPPLAPDRPSGSTGDPQRTRDGALDPRSPRLLCYTRTRSLAALLALELRCSCCAARAALLALRCSSTVSSTRVVARPAQEKGARARGNQQWIHTSRTLDRSRKILRENRPHLPPDRPSGSTGDPQFAHDEADDAPVAASPAPAPTPASAGAGTGAEADVPAWGVKLTWSKVGSAHLARRLLTGVAHNTPGPTPRHLATASRVRGESLGAQELHLPYLDRRATPFQCGRPQRPGLLVS